MAVEYVAKPRLEARKDRVVEAMRLRRQMEARLLSLPYDLKYLFGLAQANMAWLLGAQNLDDMSNECSQLYVEFGKFSESLPKWQKDTTDGFLLQLSSTLIALQLHVFTRKQTGIIGQLIKDDKISEVGTADHVNMMVGDIFECLAGAYSALVLRPGRPIRYVRQMRRLARCRRQLAAKYTKNDTTETASTSGVTNVEADVDVQSHP